MKVKVVKWCRKKWNEHNMMYIYHKQCEIKQKNHWNSSNGQIHWFPIDFLWKWSIMDQNYATQTLFSQVSRVCHLKAFWKCGGFCCYNFLNPSYGWSKLGQISKKKVVEWNRTKKYKHRWKAMDHGYMLTLSIHLAEIPTSPQNFANTSGIILWYDLRLWPIL